MRAEFTAKEGPIEVYVMNQMVILVNGRACDIESLRRLAHVLQVACATYDYPNDAKPKGRRPKVKVKP